MPRLPAPNEYVVSQVFIESSELEQLFTIHSGMAAKRAGMAAKRAGMAAERAGIISSQTSGGILANRHVWWLGKSQQ
ncbi:hypothetical protein TNCV_2897671 [Trichonephila clavipes]|nr:hypothetical protein TNCV_2897671 [Trichonephila clavipes]